MTENEFGTMQTVCNVVGMILLITSWVIPRFFPKDRIKGYRWGIILAASSIGVFLLCLITGAIMLWWR
jgi:hypothetical protein